MKKELKSGILSADKSADKSADGRPTVGGVNVIAVFADIFSTTRLYIYSTTKETRKFLIRPIWLIFKILS